jgi:hypothetical protein
MPADRRNREDDMQIARAAVLAGAILAPLGANAHAQPAPATWHPVGNVDFSLAPAPAARMTASRAPFSAC